MRSRLEADYASALDRHDGQKWEYEPKAASVVARRGQWLPDFRASFGETSTDAYVEVKPAGVMHDLEAKGGHAFEQYADEILTKMSVAWLSEPDTPLMLVFWTYGADDPDFILLGMHGIPWQAWGVSGYGPLLWPGMGQLLTLAQTLQSPAKTSDEAA